MSIAMLKHPRTVDAREWPLSNAIIIRHKRLHDVPTPEDLLRNVLEESKAAAIDGAIELKWQESSERPGYFRLVAQIPLSEVTFDQFFNGRSGYRAQYYLSPEEGVLYNRTVVNGLIPVIQEAYRIKPLSVALALIQLSLEAPHAKVWIADEKNAFDHAAEKILSAPRWVANGATTGRKVPLLPNPRLDLKGTFIHPDTKELFIDELKLDRACDLFKKGFA